MAPPKSLNWALGMVPLLMVPVVAGGSEPPSELAADLLLAATQIRDAPGSRERSEARASVRVFRDALRSGGQGPAMVVIPAGRFSMGCESDPDCRYDEGPVHDVVIPQAFALSVHEVTFEDYDRFTHPDEGIG